jgi:hypothetical protein
MGVGDVVISVNSAVVAKMQRQGIPSHRLRVVKNDPLDSPRRSEQFGLADDLTVRPPAIVTVAGPVRNKLRACDTLSRLGTGHVLYWPAAEPVEPSAETEGNADRFALFVGFTATMAASDFPRPCIIGYDSSPSRCGPSASAGDGQTQDILGSDAILLHVMWPSTPARRQYLA